VNAIARMSAQTDAFFLRLTVDGGYAQFGGLPFLARSQYHLTRREYQNRLNAPWPAPNAGTVTMKYQGSSMNLSGAPARSSRSSRTGIGRTMRYPHS
jgi:hypothetical protein